MLERLRRIPKSTWLVVGFILVAILFVVLAIYGSRPESIDKLGEDSTIDKYSQAQIVNGEELLQQLKSVDAYEDLSRDLFVFAQSEYTEYNKIPGKVVGFKVISSVTRNEKAVSFEGEYGSVKHKIAVSIELLNYSKMKVSITDKKTNSSVNDKLPSNSRLNLFIGSLPYRSDDFAIEYNQSTDSYTIRALSDAADLRAKATSYILSGTGFAPSDIKTLYIPYLK